MRQVFLCHASEDKESVVRPLAAALGVAGISYWLDEAEIKWGDSLTGKVNEGLSSSQYVIVVLSGVFITKNWPERELNAVLNLEASTGEVRVLPLIVDSAEQLLSRYVLLNDKKYIQWTGEPLEVISALQSRLDIEIDVQEEAVVTRSQSVFTDIPMPAVRKQLSQRDKDQFLRQSYGEVLIYFRNALEAFENHLDGVAADLDEIHKYKFICRVYVNGELKNMCKIWIGGLSDNSIAYSEGRYVDMESDNSYNDWLSVESDESGIFLKTSPFMTGSASEQRIDSGTEGGEYLWKKLVSVLD